MTYYSRRMCIVLQLFAKLFPCICCPYKPRYATAMLFRMQIKSIPYSPDTRIHDKIERRRGQYNFYFLNQVVGSLSAKPVTRTTTAKTQSVRHL